MVVAASGPSAGSFPVGKKIGDSERIVLRAGDTLTVLDGNGTRVLRGAGTFSLDQQAGAEPAQHLRGADRAPLGRSGCAPARSRGEDDGTALHPPNLWYVDVAQPGQGLPRRRRPRAAVARARPKAMRLTCCAPTAAAATR